MTKATTQPAVRAEGRSPRRARSPPAWRSETSLRRKGVRGGGSRRACGAKGVRGGGSRRACGAPVCLRQEGAAGAGGASEPSSTSISIEGVTLLPFRSHSDHVSTGPDGRSTRAIRPTTFGVGFRRLSCGGGRPPPALVFNHLTLYAAWCRRCTGREWPGPRSCYSSSDLSIACSVAAAARFARESEAGREGIIC